MRPATQTTRYSDQLAAARSTAKGIIATAAERLMPPAPNVGMGKHPAGAELLAEARYVSSKHAHASSCILLAAYCDRDKPSLAELRCAAAEIIGDVVAWKRKVAAIQRAVWRGERAIDKAQTIDAVFECRDQILTDIQAAI